MFMPPFESELNKYLEKIQSEIAKADLNIEEITKYVYSPECKEMTFPKYKGARGSGKSMAEYEDLISTNSVLFKDYIKDREASLKENYILEIVNCFTKAFEQVYSNECPVELVNLCKENVGNFVKYLDGFTKM